MANSRLRSKSTFPGLALISVGVLLLLHNYGGFNIGHVHLALVASRPYLLGAVKLYERTAASRRWQRCDFPHHQPGKYFWFLDCFRFLASS